MKKTIVAMLLALIPLAAKAADLESLQVKELTALHTARRTAYNTGYLINIVYVGASTQAAINITQTALSAQAPLGTADTTFGTAGSYDLSAAAYNTIGAVCDAINTTLYYKCTIVDGKRDDNSELLYDVTASASTDAKLAGGYNIKIDTAGLNATDPYIDRLGITPVAGKRVILKNCNVLGAGTGTVVVYGKLNKYANTTNNDTTTVWSAATANATALVVPVNAAYQQQWLEFAPDAHVVISVGNATTTQISGDYVECSWIEK